MRVYKLLLAAGLLLSSLQVFGQDVQDGRVVDLPKSAAGAPADSTGTVIGTIGYRSDNTPKVDHAAFEFRQVGSSEVGAVMITRGFEAKREREKIAVKDGKFRYAAFRMQLPEGRYEIVRARGSYNLPSCMMGSNPTTSSNEVEFSVPFEVKAGKTLYLGSFLAHGTMEKAMGCFMPLPMPSTIYFSHADKWQRDASVFPGIDAAQVDHANLAVNERTGYYIIAEDHLPEEVKLKDFKTGKLSHAGKIAAYSAANPQAGAGQAQAAQPSQTPATDGEATPTASSGQ